jgi:hypothetical protein
MLFSAEDEGDKVLLNMCGLSALYTTLYPRR